MMQFSKFISFASKYPLRQQQAVAQLRRFGASGKNQFRSYSKSTKQGHENHHMYPVEQEPDQSYTSFILVCCFCSFISYRRMIYVIYGPSGNNPVALLGFGGLAAYIHYNDEKRAIPKGNRLQKWTLFLCGYAILIRVVMIPFVYCIMYIVPGEAQADPFTPGPVIGGPFCLNDTEKRVVTQNDFLGKWILLYFGYTASPDVGPDQLQTMSKAIDKLGMIFGKELSTTWHNFSPLCIIIAYLTLLTFLEQELQENLKVLPVYVTIDPQRDNPAHMCAYLKEFDPRILGLTGTVNSVRQMAMEYRVYFRKVEEDKDDYLVETSHNLYLIGPNMEVVRTFGLEYSAEHLSEAIIKEMKRK
ncbi:Protein SCO1 homolog 2, mitochondrial [Linum perenne]